jgi:hypothetical protein
MILYIRLWNTFTSVLCFHTKSLSMTWNESIMTIEFDFIITMQSQSLWTWLFFLCCLHISGAFFTLSHCTWTWNESRKLWQLGLTWLSQSLWIWTWHFFYVALRSRLTNTLVTLFWYCLNYGSLVCLNMTNIKVVTKSCVNMCIANVECSSITHNLSPLVDSDKYWP